MTDRNHGVSFNQWQIMSSLKHTSGSAGYNLRSKCKWTDIRQNNLFHCFIPFFHSSLCRRAHSNHLVWIDTCIRQTSKQAAHKPTHDGKLCRTTNQNYFLNIFELDICILQASLDWLTNTSKQYLTGFFIIVNINFALYDFSVDITFHN